MGRAALRRRFADWVTRHQEVARQEVLLHRKRIYILPTRHGVLFGTIVFVMLMGSLNYNNSMAFLFTFLLAGLGVNAMWHTHRNLLGMRVVRGSAKPVFAGQTAQFTLTLENPGRTPRYAVAAQWEDEGISLNEVPQQGSSTLTVNVAAPRRGLLRPGRFKLYSRYPLGLFQAWTWIEFDMSCIVYPKPAPFVPPRPSRAADHGSGSARAGTQQGTEDFTGLRDHQPSDSMKRIAWKAAARNEFLVSKEFSGQSRESVWLDWESLSGRETEERLSILSRWVLDAAQSGERYGLSIPGTRLPPDVGERHRRRCLEALGLYGEARSPMR